MLHQEEIGATGAKTRGQRTQDGVRRGSRDLKEPEAATSEGEEDLWRRQGEAGGGREGGRGATEVEEEEFGLRGGRR